jgi:hypothetical protein
MRLVLAFGRFWWDFVIGEDWRIAAAVTATLAGGAVLVAGTSLSDGAITAIVGLAILALVAASIVAPARRARR